MHAKPIPNDNIGIHKQNMPYFDSDGVVNGSLEYKNTLELKHGIKTPKTTNANYFSCHNIRSDNTDTIKFINNDYPPLAFQKETREVGWLEARAKAIPYCRIQTIFCRPHMKQHILFISNK